jgi:hypothetical protein
MALSEDLNLLLGEGMREKQGEVLNESSHKK